MRRAAGAGGDGCRHAASVWIAGPPGSGRQRTAEAIHYAAEGAAGALFPLDCAVLSGELVISTVQAWPRGGRRRKGPPAARSCWPTLSLAARRADQPGPGPLRTARLSLRLIATARQPLEELLPPGKFRQDLGLTLLTISIHLPPLAERREDLPLVAQLFLEEVNAGRKTARRLFPRGPRRASRLPVAG